MSSWNHDGLEFAFAESGFGKPFLFQHGLGADSRQPFSLVKPPSGFRLLAFDFRAHGETKPLGDESKIGLASFADDAKALLDHLKIDKAIIGGISMGAAVAVNFALRFPERVMGLVLSRPAWLDGPRQRNVELFAKVAQLIRAYGPEVGAEKFKHTDEYFEVLGESTAGAASLLALFAYPRAAETVARLERLPRDAPYHATSELAAIKAPTLVLANRQDPIHPFNYGQILAKRIAGAEFKEITPKSQSLDKHNADTQSAISNFLVRRLY